MTDRAVNFERLRGIRCGACGHEWHVDAVWLERFDQGYESCPQCRTDCRLERRPDFWALDDDAVNAPELARDLYWYHSSAHANWPDPAFDPTAAFTDVTRRRFDSIGAPGALERWAARQKTKALHLGTYEAAIENMLRRMSDQDAAADQFYLYRVRLAPGTVIDAALRPEPTDFLGDVQFSDVGAPDAEVLRYVNTHEDPSSVSLAVSLSAIGAVQGVPIPLPTEATDLWIANATARLLEASGRPSRTPSNQLERMRRSMPSALSDAARELEKEAAGMLPLGLRDRLDFGWREADMANNPATFPSKIAGLVQLVRNPPAIFAALDKEPWRTISRDHLLES